MILLIGNYPLDRQQSMQRFALMMLAGLQSLEALFQFARSFVERSAYLTDLVDRARSNAGREIAAGNPFCELHNALQALAGVLRQDGGQH